MASYLTTVTNGEFLTEFFYRAKGLPMYDAVDPSGVGAELPNPDLAFERLEPAAGDHRLLLGSLRAYVQHRWRDHRLGPERVLLARTRSRGPTTGAFLLPRQHHHRGERDRRPRDRPPVVRQRRVAQGVARHLAQRGLRDLLRVDLRRGPRGRPRPRRSTSYASEDPDFEDLWFPAPAALQRLSELFHTPVYDRGAMTLQALREKIGTPTFFDILRTWYAENGRPERHDGLAA